MHYTNIILHILHIFHFFNELDLISEVSTLKSSSTEKDLVSKKCKEVTLNFLNGLSDKNYIHIFYIFGLLKYFLTIIFKMKCLNV